MTTLNDLPDLTQASADAFAGLWNYVKDGEDETLKGLVAAAHHTTSAALDGACEVFEVDRSFLLPPSRGGTDKPPE